MSTVPKTTAASTPVPIDRADVQESILAVVNALAGKKNLTAVDHAKMTEDVLFASFVHDKLQKASPALAKSLLKLLKGKFDTHTKAKESQPLFRSIEEILKEGVSSKKLTGAKMDEILKSSFGQAQLDGTAGRLSRRARGDGLEGVLDRVAKNGVATQKQVDSFEKRIETFHHLKAASSTSQRRELTKVFNSMTEEKTDSTPGTGGSTNPGTGPVTGTPETDKPKPLPKPEDRPTDPSDLVYKPVSERDGKPLFMIPDQYRDWAHAVDVYNQADELVETLRYTGRGDDGRPYFRSDRSGEQYGNDFTARIRLIDGTFVDYVLDSGTRYGVIGSA